MLVNATSTETSTAASRPETVIAEIAKHEGAGSAGGGGLHAGHDAGPGRRVARRGQWAGVARVSEPAGLVVSEARVPLHRECLHEKEPMVHPGAEGSMEGRTLTFDHGPRLACQRNPPARFEGFESRKVGPVIVAWVAGAARGMPVDVDRFRDGTSQCLAGRNSSPEADRDGPGRVVQPAPQQILNRTRGRRQGHDGGHAPGRVVADAPVGGDDDLAGGRIGRTVDGYVSTILGHAGVDGDAAPRIEPVVLGHTGKSPDIFGLCRLPATAGATRHHRHEGHGCRQEKDATKLHDAHQKRSHGVTANASNLSPSSPAHDSNDCPRERRRMREDVARTRTDIQ